MMESTEGNDTVVDRTRVAPIDDERTGVELPLSSRYRLLQCIARGGMGSVYLGVQRGAAGFERPVAIKRTHSYLLADPEIRDAILREAHNASAVRHPNVVSIDDVDEVDGELLLVMDYIDGGALSQLLTAGTKMPLGVKLSVILDACAGLSAIHTAVDADGRPLGLVHRDVSPQNILVGLDGAARITDFGIAKAALDPKRTAMTMRRGKFGYMAPEYLLTNTATTSSDIFALGVVLWEALAGRRLFKGESNVDTLRLTAAAEVPSLRAEDPTISIALEAVVRKALAQSPADRFRSMADFGCQLEAATQGLVAPRPEVIEHVREIFGPRRSLHEVMRSHSNTLSVSDAEIIEHSAVHSLPPSRPGAADTVPLTVAGVTPTTRIHRAFRLEDAPAVEVAPPTPPPVVALPAAPPRRSRLRVVGLLAFVAFVVASTAALVYVGLSPDVPTSNAAGTASANAR